ncbi:unnamed protein product [Gadus morhua 'NCC']
MFSVAVLLLLLAAGSAVQVPAPEFPEFPVSPEAVRVPDPESPKSPVSPAAFRVTVLGFPGSPVSPEADRVPAPESSPDSPLTLPGPEPALKPSSLEPTPAFPVTKSGSPAKSGDPKPTPRFA